MQRHPLGGLVPALLLSVTLGARAVAQETPERPDERPAHPVVLWTFDDDLARPGYLELVRRLGGDAVQCRDGHRLDEVQARGLAWYEDHAVGKGVLALRPADAEPAWERFWEARREPWPDAEVRARPVSWHDPVVRAELLDRARSAAARGADGALGVVLEDEPGIGVRANPTDWDLSPARVEAFREWMRSRVEVLAALNERWGTEYESWDEVRPWTTAAIRARELERAVHEWNLAPWMDTREFQDQDFAALIRDLVAASQEEAPELPVGLAGLQAPSAFGGYHYDLLAPACTFLEPYDIGLALPVCRDLSRPGTVLAQTVFPSPEDDHRLARWRLWTGVARGADLTIVWSSHDLVERESLEPTAYARALVGEIAVLRRIAPLLAAAEPVDHGVRVLLSQPSVRVRWMRDSVPDGDTWPRRFGSYEAEHSTAIRQRVAAWAGLGPHEVRFVGDAELAGGLDERARLLVLPDALALSDAQVAAVEEFVAAGGSVVQDAESGAYDDAGRARDVAALPAGERVVVDPGFLRLGSLASRACPSGVEVHAYRSTGEEPVPVELRHLRLDGRRVVVAVPRWRARVRADGSSTGTVPAGRWTLVLEPRSPAAAEGRDETHDRALSGKRWTLEAPSHRALVVTWRE